MRRLYVAPHATHMAHREIWPHTMTYWMALYNPAVPGDKERWGAAGKPIVITMNLMNTRHLDIWEANSDVTTLPHPVYHPDKPIAQAGDLPQNSANTVDGVQHLVRAGLGVGNTDTIHQVHSTLATWHSGFKRRQ